VSADYHEQFAAAYDTFYQKRDVDAEVAQALDILGLSDCGVGARILDFGCGTGSHALAMARRGYNIVGLDASQSMIEQARRKVDENLTQFPAIDDNGRARLLPSRDTTCHERPIGETQGDITFVYASPGGEWCNELRGSFDSVVSFFNVLNCLPSAQAMVETLSAIRRCMKPGATAYFEVWNGAAVFADAPRPDVRHFPLDRAGHHEMIRITLPEVNHIEQRCTLRYRVLELDKLSGSYTEFDSIHNLHFLTPVQYRHVFTLAGFTILDEFPKSRPHTRVNPTDWYMAYLVRST